MKSLATQLNEVITMSAQELIKFCYSNGFENARAYTEDYLREIAVSIIMDSSREVKYQCNCGGTFEQVAFNSDLDSEIELWDCICNSCGKHSILDYPVEEE